MRLGSCRLISAQPLIGSDIRAFCESSALWVLEVLCLSTVTHFLSNRSKHLVVDGCQSKLVNVASGVGSVFGQLLFHLST